MQRQGLIFEIESKIKKIQEAYETMLVQKELQIETESALQAYLLVTQELTMFDGLFQVDQQRSNEMSKVRQQYFTLVNLIEQSDCTQLESIHEAIAGYLKLRPALIVEYHE